MLRLDELAALDLAIWLRSGTEAARRLEVRQSTVSRRCRHCLELLQLGLEKHQEEWRLVGDRRLIVKLRQLHQLARWRGMAPLRLEGTYWSGPLLATPPPPGWIVGQCNIVGIPLPQALLRDGVIDAWLTGGPDWPEPDDPDFATLQLCTMPVHLVVTPHHPLLNQAAISWDDVIAFPSLALPEGMYPQTEAVLRRLGLWNSPQRMRRYRHDRWEGRAEADLSIGYATTLSEQVAGSLQRLPLPLPLQSGEALVVRRTWADHPACRALVALLLERLQGWTEHCPEIEVCQPATASATGTDPAAAGGGG